MERVISELHIDTSDFPSVSSPDLSDTGDFDFLRVTSYKVTLSSDLPEHVHSKLGDNQRNDIIHGL